MTCNGCGNFVSNARLYADGVHAGMWLCQPCSRVGSTSITFGLPAEWELFAQRHPRFVARFAELQRFINLVVSRKLEDSSLADRTIFYLGRLAVEDFLEVILNAGNGYGVAAMKLLRPLYERVITMMYLMRHPQMTSDFIDYHRVQMRKVVNHMKAAGADPSKYFTAEELTEIQARYQAVKNRFLETLCKKCGTTRDGMSWTKLDLATMARKVGFGAAHAGLGYFPTLQLHTTLQGLATRLEAVEGGTSFREEPQRGLAADALIGAYLCLTVGLEEQIKHFKLEADINRLHANYLECLEEYQAEKGA